MSELTREEIEELFERSKNDHAMIVGSEIRALCNMALRSLAPSATEPTPIPTVAMIQAAVRHYEDNLGYIIKVPERDFADIYCAMLAAAPAPAPSSPVEAVTITDADRYQWLRKPRNYVKVNVHHEQGSFWEAAVYESLDRYIDAAIEKDRSYMKREQDSPRDAREQRK